MASIKAEAKDSGSAKGHGKYTAAGKGVSCPHCGENEFYEGKAQLNTRGMTFLNLDWMNKSSSTLACTKCGMVQWFLKKPERL